jgi:hypothetical protein
MKFTIGRPRIHQAFTSSRRKHLDHAKCRPPRSFPTHPDIISDTQTEKPSSDGFVAKPPRPAYTARPHHAKRRARQAFHLRRPDGLLSLASFLDLATTDALAPCPRLRLALLAPCGLHLIPSATRSLEPSLLVSPLLGGPARLRPFTPVLHLHKRKPSRNQHLQY